jgi:ActD protein
MTAATTANNPIYGFLAQFDDADSLVSAAQRTREAGYRRIDAYAPFPVDGLSEALGLTRTSLSWIVLLGGVVGGVLGFGLQYYVAVIAEPINVGGKPLNSWPSFVPVTFELAILGAAIAAVVGLLVLNRLPMPYHPLFNVEQFTRASQDGFFLAVEAADPQFDAQNTKEFLQSLQPREVYDVPR